MAYRCREARGTPFFLAPPGVNFSGYVVSELTVEQGGFSVICSRVNREIEKVKVHNWFTMGSLRG